MNRKLLFPVLSILLYLFVFPESAAEGARKGLLLWYNSVVPVLFPFMLVSGLLLQFRLLERIPDFITYPVRKLFGCSKAGSFAVIAGFLCGFPIGAKITYDLEQTSQINREESRFLFRFVNNPSPGFLISYLAAGQMNMQEYALLFPLNILGASIVYGLFTSASFRKKEAQQTVKCRMAAADTAEVWDGTNSFSIIDQCIFDSMQNTLRLGGYILFFSVLSEAAFLLPAARQMPILFLVSNIEITSGIAGIASSSVCFPLRFILVNAVAAFGGLSAALQTAGICRMEVPHFLEYIKSRAIITLLSVLLSVCSLFFCQFLL